MRVPIVAGNWKMHGSRAAAAALVDEIVASLGESKSEIVICPPFVYIPLVAERLTGTRIKCGGQDLSTQDPGAFTGEVAAEMLKDYGCDYCIVGHSERRTLYGETDQVVAEKFAKALDSGLIPILCIGETLNEREQGETETVLARQLDTVIDHCGIGGFSNAVLAYEPVWAIGTGKTATPEQAQDAHQFIRNKLTEMDGGIAQNLRIQYGGSVKADNAKDLFDQRDIDGGLIGGASLKAADFVTICHAALHKT